MQIKTASFQTCHKSKTFHHQSTPNMIKKTKIEIYKYTREEHMKI